jgi:hypothetical protein
VIKLAPVQPVVVKKTTSVWRKLMWNDDTNWQGGCTMGVWSACQQLPPIPIDNRCYGNSSGSGTFPPNLPPFTDETVNFTKGFTVVWTRQEPVFKTVLGVQTPVGTRIHFKQFIRGLWGVGAKSQATYRLGTDSQDSWSVLIPVPDPSRPQLAVDKRTFAQLIVAEGAAPNMWYSEHLVLRQDQITITWRIVCNKGDKANDDQDQGSDHDRSGDYNKYRHHSESYHGYNDDQPSSWDQGD